MRTERNAWSLYPTSFRLLAALLPVSSRVVVRALTVFVCAHLVLDMAMPSVPGAFRLDADESVVGVRAKPIQREDLAPPREGEAFERILPLSCLPAQAFVCHRGEARAPDPTVFVRRRAPASDQSLNKSSEDH